MSNNLVKTDNKTILSLEHEAIDIIKPKSSSDQERLLTNSLFYLNEEIKKNKALGTAIQKDPVRFAIYLKHLITLGVDISQKQAYFLPYGNEITSVLDYKTLMSLIKKHTNVKSIDAQLVYSNEPFVVEQGKVIKHQQNPFASKEQKGDLVGAYSVFTLEDGTKEYYFASMEEIKKVRECSKSSSSNFSPWNNWFEEMVKKTVIRKGMKFYPMILDNEQKEALDNIDNDVDFNLQKTRNVECQSKNVNTCPEKQNLLNFINENGLKDKINDIAKYYKLNKDSQPGDYLNAESDLKLELEKTKAQVVNQVENKEIDINTITNEQLDKEMEDIANVVKDFNESK